MDSNVRSIDLTRILPGSVVHMKCGCKGIINVVLQVMEPGKPDVFEMHITMNRRKANGLPRVIILVGKKAIFERVEYIEPIVR